MQEITKVNQGLVDVFGKPLMSEETKKATHVPTHEEQRAAALRANPQFRKLQREIERVMKQLKSDLSPSEKLQRATKIVMARRGKPVSATAAKKKK